MKLKNKFNQLTTQSRLYGTSIPILALTGGIATGKSETTKLLISKKVPTIDADKLVKKIYSTQEALDFISNKFPNTIVNSTINFPKLRNIFFDNTSAQIIIEKFISPKLKTLFIQEIESLNSSFIFYDVPLLFEKNIHTKVDVSICIYAPLQLQIERLLTRDKISIELAKKIISKQINIEKKQQMANYTISNQHSLSELAEEIDTLLIHLFESN